MSDYKQKEAWLDSLAIGQVVSGYDTVRKLPVVALKIGTAQTHGSETWSTTAGQTFPASFNLAHLDNLVLLAPTGRAWTEADEPVAHRLTPDDFYTRYDEHHIFSFFEVEEGGRYYTYDHVNAAQWGQEIGRYLALTDSFWPYQTVDLTAISHVWVVGEAYPYAPEEPFFHEVPEGTPGAVPASVYAP